MSDWRFKVVCTGRNSVKWVKDCIESIYTQEEMELMDVCIVDDASTDGTAELVEHFGEKTGFDYTLQTVRKYAMYNQLWAIGVLDPQPEDVIVWVDLDDRLASDWSLTKVREVYDAKGVDLTYGTYRPEPFSKTCAMPKRYDPQTEADNDYRKADANGYGMRYNHLRTLKFKIFDQIPKDYFLDRNGNYFTTGPDTAIMLPALELAHGNYECIPDCLYIYNSENPNSEWRVVVKEVNSNHQDMLEKPRLG